MTSALKTQRFGKGPIFLLKSWSPISISPLTVILRKLAEKGYAGPLSVELFLPKFQQGDPYEIAREIRQKAEGVMRQARVL